MVIYTYQLAHWRRLKPGVVPLLDTTVKTGESRLAPTWGMVVDVKAGRISEAEYTHRYRAILDYWWFQDLEFWDDLLNTPVIALGCYCPAGAFCHRHLLVEFLRSVTEVDYRGELSTPIFEIQ